MRSGEGRRKEKAEIGRHGGLAKYGKINLALEAGKKEKISLGRVAGPRWGFRFLG